jgi:hypothetical protein
MRSKYKKDKKRMIKLKATERCSRIDWQRLEKHVKEEEGKTKKALDAIKINGESDWKTRTVQVRTWEMRVKDVGEETERYERSNWEM